jgi:hypothetical protein
MSYQDVKCFLGCKHISFVLLPSIFMRIMLYFALLRVKLRRAMKSILLRFYYSFEKD